MTCMLLGSSFGEKLTPFLVLKTRPSKIPAIRNENLELRHGFGKHLWKEIKRLQDDYTVQIYGNRTGWWNDGLSIAWLDYNFKYRSHPDHPVLLLWDDFSGHWTDEVVAHAMSLNVHLLKVPGGHTSVCQPADISWNRPLKQRLRRQWIKRLSTQLSRVDGDGTQRVTAPTREAVVRWVVEAWDDLSTTTISNGFSGILRESPNDEDTEATFNVIADKLAQLHLLDEDVGELESEDDIVDRVLREASV
ncbi:hypothetical protein Pcac1_g18529 [Phytophthora cactorum]|nr:hypothetical protein Pcac1_g18529 [Phytophthora cactorum]